MSNATFSQASTVSASLGRLFLLSAAEEGLLAGPAQLLLHENSSSNNQIEPALRQQMGQLLAQLEALGPDQVEWNLLRAHSLLRGPL